MIQLGLPPQQVGHIPMMSAKTTSWSLPRWQLQLVGVKVGQGISEDRNGLEMGDPKASGGKFVSVCLVYCTACPTDNYLLVVGDLRLQQLPEGRGIVGAPLLVEAVDFGKVGAEDLVAARKKLLAAVWQLVCLAHALDECDLRAHHVLGTRTGDTHICAAILGNTHAPAAAVMAHGTYGTARQE